MTRKTQLVLFLILLMRTFLGSAFGVVTRTVPGDYATVSAAVAWLNTQAPLTDSYVINVNAGHTETLTGRIDLTVTGTASNSITIQKSGAGINPKLTAFTGTSTPSSATPDGMFALRGADYVTIDGIDLYDPNTANPANMEYGFGFFKAGVADGAQYNTIKNCSVSLNRNNFASGTSPMVEGSVCILMINSTAVTATTSITPTGAAGTNSYNKFYSNNLSNANYGIVFSGYAAASPFTLGDTGNDVGGSALSTGNTIVNFGGGVSATNPSAGVRANNQWGVNISYNTINSNNGSGVNHPSTLRGIYAQAGTSANANINHNTLTIKGGGTSAQISAIECAIGSTAASNTVNINNNTVTNCTYTTATSGTFYSVYCTSNPATTNMNYNIVSNNTMAGTGSWYGVYNSNSTATTVVNMNYNQVFNNTKTGASGTIFCLRPNTAQSTVLNNEVYNNTITNASGTSAAVVYGLYNFGSPTYENYQNNNIYNLSVTGTNTSSSSIACGILSNTAAAAVKTISNNTIYALQLNTAGAGNVYGIAQYLGTADISRNKIYNLSTTSATAFVSGLFLSSGTTNNAHNNMIYTLQAAGSTTAATAPSIMGIRIAAGTTNNVYYNTVFLNNDGTNAYYSTAALYIVGGTTNTLRNNIFINKSNPGATGRSVALWKSSIGVTNIGALTDKNIYSVGDETNEYRLVGYFSNVNLPSIEEYKAALADRDQGSYYENVAFVSENDPIDLHINPDNPTRVEGNGIYVAAFDVDFDGDDRSDTTPDIGADEGAFTAVQAPPGTPVYASPANAATNVAVNATLTWSANSEGGTPTSYEVYMGQSDPPDYVATVLTGSYAASTEFGKTYYWKVKAINNEGEAEGAVWSFSVADGIPVLTAPANSGTNVSATPTFTWGAVTGVTGYKIQCGTSSGATDVLDKVACATNSYVMPTALPYSTLLYWSVYSVNGAQEVQSLEWSFTTMADPNNYAYPYTMDFEEITTAGNLPQYWSKTGSKWTSMTATGTYSRAPRGGTDYLTCAYSSTTSDWLFSRGMYLDASKLYDLGMWYNTDGLSGWTSLKMYIGTTATGAAMTTELASVLSPVNTTYAQITKTAWQPPTSGVYYVGFQVIANSTPWYMCFDDFSIAETPVNPLFAVNPTSKAFGLKGVFTQTDQLFTVSNAGQGTLNVSSIQLTGDSCFSLVGVPSLPIALNASTPSTTFTVRYNPTTAGDFTGTVTIMDDLASKAERTIALSASAFDPILPIPYTQNFSAGTSMPTNWTQSTSTWTIASSHGLTNNGIYKNIYSTVPNGWFQTQPIGPITGTTRLSFQYRLVEYGSYPSVAFTPAAGDVIKVWVSTDEGNTFTQYDEINVGNHIVSTTWAERQVWLSGAKADANARVVLKFEAAWATGDWYIDIDDIVVEHVSATPLISITPASKAYGDVQVLTSSASQTFNIKNAGGGTLTISDINISGTDANQFALTNANSLPANLGAGQSINISVVFNPTTIGAKTATLNIVDNLAKANNTVALSGSGIDMTIYELPYLLTLSETPQAQYWQQFTIGTGLTNRWTVDNTALAGGSAPEWHCTYQNINPGTTRLVSPPINVSDLSELVVKFTQVIDDYGVGCTYKLRYGYSTSSFFDIWTLASAANATSTSEVKTFSLTTELVGHDVIFLCWEVEGNLNQFDNWYIDNIKFLPYNTEINQTVAAGGSANVTIPAITVGAGQVSPQVSISGISGTPLINAVATYQPAGTPPTTGMVLTITGGDLSGVTLNLTHNLGFIPPWIKYHVGSGELITVINDLTWTTTTATITIDAAKGPNDIIVLFPKSEDEPLAVNLSSFSAVLTADMFVKIAWVAESETAHSGYNVLRSTEKNISNAVYVNSELISSGTLLGSQISYSYTDSATDENTTYYYWLESVSLEGSSEFFGPLAVTVGGGSGPETPEIPVFTALLNAYPNPFNPSTNLRYSMKDAGSVQIDIYNTKGQLVRRMNANHATPGYYSMTWDGRDDSGRTVGSGVYMYQMTSGQYKAAKKMILAK